MRTIRSYRYAKQKAMDTAREFARKFFVVARKFIRNGYYQGNEWIAHGTHGSVVLEQIPTDYIDECPCERHLRIETGMWVWMARVFKNGGGA